MHRPFSISLYRRSSSEHSRNIKPITTGPDLIRASIKKSPISQKTGPFVCRAQKRIRFHQNPSSKVCITITSGRLLDIKFPSCLRLQIWLAPVRWNFSADVRIIGKPGVQKAAVCIDKLQAAELNFKTATTKVDNR